MLFFEPEEDKKVQNNKKVQINTKVNVILIPSKEEMNAYSDELWYKYDQYEQYKNEALMEIKCYAAVKNISIEEAYYTIYK
mgnify:CR=1 FL=1|jgi:hypothetical protein